MKCNLHQHAELLEPTAALVQIGAFGSCPRPAALNLSTPQDHHISKHLNRSTSGGQGPLRRCVDIQCAVLWEVLKQPSNRQKFTKQRFYPSVYYTLRPARMLSGGMQEAGAVLSQSSGQQILSRDWDLDRAWSGGGREVLILGWQPYGDISEEGLIFMSRPLQHLSEPQ